MNKDSNEDQEELESNKMGQCHVSTFSGDKKEDFLKFKIKLTVTSWKSCWEQDKMIDYWFF